MSASGAHCVGGLSSAPGAAPTLMLCFTQLRIQEINIGGLPPPTHTLYAHDSFFMCCVHSFFSSHIQQRLPVKAEWYLSWDLLL